MEIKYLGHSSFLLKTKDAKLITDPFDPAFVGFRFPKSDADIVTVSHQHKDHNQANVIDGAPLVIDMPGEFEKKGIRIFGYLSYHDKNKGAERGENIIYKIEIEEIVCLHCGDLGALPTTEMIDAIGEIDVLFVPVGGKASLGPDEAIDLIKEFEPSVVVPMHYKTPRHNQKIFADLAPIDDFLKKIGAESVAPVEKLVVKKGELTEEMKVVVMKS
jgi:L-ascorbate metabolism protein UlaG (beta-lactamase superfamily)